MANPRNNLLFKPTERLFLDERSPVPLYHQLEMIILDRIVKQKASGRMLPPEKDIIEIFNVSRATVKKSLDNLASKGVIERKRAVGTTVIRHHITEDLGRLKSYTEEMEEQGLSVETQVLEVGTHIPDEAVRQRLQLKEGEETLFIRRLRGTNEFFPVVLLQSEIPTSYGIDPNDDFENSLYALLEGKYQIQIEWAEEEIYTGSASKAEAKLLNLKSDKEVLVMNRLSYARDSSPLESVRAVYRPDQYRFSIQLRR
ncbi:GntR family transcriptional regulator [Bythopirellula polymerisocia]|uniref:HTH-type transcriptional repressor DasR n=1 Tax=Bythopirellula polymerisocia TaxID=2528003 RepID=A0A5C6CEY7_9BACT|nr:GntR family transcriptional regulator [Bythopirellula polymerisocia]TWU21369.1 HTH-type transcriptional repressor DasR [Bythopirellula polymerisocia]